jgi:hypothetical protein
MPMHRDSESGEKPGAPSASTLDGRRLAIGELNLGQVEGRGRFRQLLRNLSLFLAGMYTGESCAGTPHGERKPHGEGKPRDEGKL